MPAIAIIAGARLLGANKAILGAEIYGSLTVEVDRPSKVSL